MEVDATDPECVSIKEMTDGCGWNFGIGKMVLWSRADRGLRDQGLTKEDVKAQGLFGKDNFHPSEAGYAKVRDMQVAFLKKQLEK